MADPRFYRAAGPFTLSALAQIAGAEVRGDGERLIRDVASLATAGPDDISFLDNAAYARAFSASRAGACIVSPAVTAMVPDGMSLLVADNAYKAYALVARAFYPDSAPAGGVAEGAHVSLTAHIGAETQVAAGAVIGDGAEIGSRCRIGANAVIGEGVRIGDDCDIGVLVSIRFAIVGSHVRIYAGARIGEDGFGYASDAAGHTHIPQLGRVVIGDAVEIGANTTIDRGAGPDTVIGDGCIIDNLVQIGHNVVLGRGCIIVSQVGISGSTTLGDYVIIGGQAGLTGHLTVGDGVRIGAQAGVMNSLDPQSIVLGSPAMPYKEFWRQMAVLKRLAAVKKKTGE
jgi:UDP-3-O-[3-hydroxymyristoyl] glucosamine N-acyltransferase